MVSGAARNTMHKRFLLIFLLGVLSAACSFRPAVPMPKIEYFANDEPSGPLVVLLRGIGGRMDYYERNGWVDAARDARHAMDMVAPDAHFGYYVGRSIATRLHEDIIGPARAQGYQDIWLAGISLGGMGALLYSREHAGHVSRIYLFAPYLGNGTVLAEIQAAGGLEHWDMPANKAHEHQYLVWHYLKQILRDPQRRVTLYLAYGEDDHLIGHDLLAAYMPTERVIKIAGAHDDRTFLKLWQRMLENGWVDSAKEKTPER